MAREHFELLAKEGLRALDGYGSERDILVLQQLFPDPLQLPWLVGAGFAAR